MFDVEYSAKATKALRRLDRVAQDRVSRTIGILRNNPRPPRATRLVGEADLWRVRTGDYRIIYSIEDDRLVVFVVAVGHRREIYR